MSLNQTKPFFNYSLVSAIRPDAVALIHDPVLGDVNIKVQDLLLMGMLQGVLINTVALFNDGGGTSHICALRAVRTDVDDNGNGIWSFQLTDAS